MHKQRSDENMQERMAKPQAPFSVVLTVESCRSGFATLKAYVHTEIDLKNASLIAIPFNGLQILKPVEPLVFSLLAGQESVFEIKVRLDVKGSGSCTVEVSSEFENAKLVENDSVDFLSGKPMIADVNPMFPGKPSNIEIVPSGIK